MVEKLTSVCVCDRERERRFCVRERESAVCATEKRGRGVVAENFKILPKRVLWRKYLSTASSLKQDL